MGKLKLTVNEEKTRVCKVPEGEFDFSGHTFGRTHSASLLDNILAQLDAFIADEHSRSGDELADLLLALAAERAVERILGIAAGDLAHPRLPSRNARALS
jgi:hypothetical protein